MNILAHLVNSRAVDFYAFNGSRITSKRLNLATTELNYIAIRRRLAQDETNALVGFIARHYPNDSHTASELLRGWCGLYIYRENGYYRQEDADIITAIVNDKGLA